MAAYKMFEMKSSSRIGRLLINVLFLTACSASSREVISQTQPPLIVDASIPTKTTTPRPAFTPQPTRTSVPTPTATFTLWPTKEVLLQFGIFGGDGGWDEYAFVGQDTPKLILYADGQLIVQKEDDGGVWFEETTLTVSQMCSFLSQVEKAGFFTLAFDDSSASVVGIPTANPIYKFDNTTQFSEGGPYYVIQVNGPKPIDIYINRLR
jgi:hypothetical protein